MRHDSQGKEGSRKIKLHARGQGWSWGNPVFQDTCKQKELFLPPTTTLLTYLASLGHLTNFMSGHLDTSLLGKNNLSFPTR